MPDFLLPEDEAALYVIGELTPSDRADFEARLAQSPELRALVRELEVGTVVLTMATPRHQPPPALWREIKRAVAQEKGRKLVYSPFWSQWWLNGWTAAAACLVGWLLYAFWAHRPAHSDLLTAPYSSEAHLQPGSGLAESSQIEQASVAVRSPSSVTNTTSQLLHARMLEQAALREVLELKTQLSHLSESLAQQQALLTDPNRLEFIQLRPISDAKEDSASVTISPGLQRAISLAMAREVGWGSADSSADLDVDFVDLRAGTNGTPSSVAAKPRDPSVATVAELSPAITAKNPAAPATTITTIPAFVRGNNIVVAIDSTIAPSGSHLDFSAAADNDDHPRVVSAELGENPLVATLDGISTNTGSLTITARTPSGTSHVFHAPIHGTTRPPRDRDP